MNIKNRIILVAPIIFFFFAPYIRGDTMPFIVDDPFVVSRTAFVTGEEIEVVYPIRYLEGYEFLREKASPNSMSFYPFEVVGFRVDREYKQGNENFIDLIYVLHHIGEKKGPIKVPAQIFYYVKKEPGKSIQELKVEQFESKEVVLSYVTTLTEDADDIRDEIDFGKFKNKAYLLIAIAIVIPALFVFLAFYVLFRRPEVRVISAGLKGEEEKVKDSDYSEVVVSKRRALHSLRKYLEGLEREIHSLNEENIKKLELDLYQHIRELLIAYVPETNYSYTPYDFIRKLNSINIRYKVFLLELSLRLDKYQGYISSQKSFLFPEGVSIENISSAEKEIYDLIDLAERFRLHEKILYTLYLYFFNVSDAISNFFEYCRYKLKAIFRRK